MNNFFTMVFSVIALAAAVLFFAQSMPTELARRILS
ncbi:hypothetical protein Pan258_01040 [Symmachiella dynata]|uniref:Uncharacterized protein n=1 Tax=Symmachiella dynata TaxID=2527995 RepID=A0A517ZGQ2_9PLAN|nr:hypothetical protein Pan258_01040 [Symmachiella dynata]QDU41654.1 hypothetical protein Mal52_01070 [Symmachiella dynata]|tara:strand:- start:459 stop:566 length:108 start_codon:yes stop_codon:yes gene_type:complete